jgi:deoxyribodipyrimidine photo-lyase
MKPVIVWYRRDLRTYDHLPLYHAIQTDQPILPVFIFDPAILKSKRASPARLEFMLNGLSALRDDLRQMGGDLYVAHGNPADVLSDLVNKTHATDLFYGIDYTPYARKRDETIAQSLNIVMHPLHDRLLVPPHTIATADGRPYTVYTPFKNKWRALQKPTCVDIHPTHFYDISHLPQAEFPIIRQHGVQIPPATSEYGRDLLSQFMGRGVYDYADGRNRLGNPSDNPQTQTSFLSPYIRFGLVSIRDIYWSAREAYETTSSNPKRDSVSTFVDEIIWHEFYTHILWHFPHVKTRNFNPKFDDMTWQYDHHHFTAWCEGRTGYPIVDAAMRQLLKTGWMHNRARMIVASFLTKDLLIDWRLGEAFFMQHLLDGDTAANNGGWQWSAGTGTDAQPFFRIFNPYTQSEKFDPSGDFIRYWIPELADVPDKYIHAPHTMPNPPQGYPAPIVDHDTARKIALEAHTHLKKEDKK